MRKIIRLLAFIILLALGFCTTLRGQEEQDRPAGEATVDMVRSHDPAQVREVFPTPQEVYAAGSAMDLGPRGAFGVEIAAPGNPQLFRDEFAKRMASRFGATPGTGNSARIVFAIDPANLPADQERMGKTLATLHDPDAYVIRSSKADGRSCLLVAGKSAAALWRAFATVTQLVEETNGRLRLPAVEIVDYPQMQQRGLFVDLGGQGFMVGPSRWELPEWKKFVDWMVDQKFNQLWLEFIGSGRLMGNLNPEKGEWIGFSLNLKSYPELVARDRPIRRWDEAQQKVVDDTFTSPNVKSEFARELIDYAQARGIKCVLLIGYDYFANQLPYTLGVPANDPANRDANKVYDAILREIVERYSNAQGAALITIENKNVPPSMVDVVARRAREAAGIIHSINPRMDVGILNDYLEWRPREEFEHYAEVMPRGVYQIYSPHVPPQNKSWKRLYGDVFRYELFSQYAWNHVAYIFPERVQNEVRESYLNGYRRIVTQAWYADVFCLNYQAFAAMSWNSTGASLEHFWDTTLERTFGKEAKQDMKTALAHTRFDRRSDIISRMVVGDYLNKTFRFWDMYSLTRLPGLNDDMLQQLQDDAEASLGAARRARPHIRGAEAEEMADVVITSAERRLYLATSARAWIRALQAQARGDLAAARSAKAECLREAGKLTRAAVKIGIEYPMATHDDEVVAHYRQTLARIPSP